MTYGVVDRKSHKFYTYMSAVFEAIGQRQKQYNWLITDCECYPENEEFEQLFSENTAGCLVRNCLKLLQRKISSGFGAFCVALKKRFR